MEATRNPYAPSTASLAGSGADVRAVGSRIWRDEKVLIVARDAGDLPHRCVKCNDAADEPTKERKVYWHHPGFYLLLLVNVFVYVIVALIARKTGKVSPGLCARHKQRRVLGLVIGWGGFLLCFAGMSIAFGSDSPGLGLLLLLGTLASIVTGMVMSRIVYARRIDDRYLYLRGCDEAFLAELPQFRPGARDF